MLYMLYLIDKPKHEFRSREYYTCSVSIVHSIAICLTVVMIIKLTIAMIIILTFVTIIILTLAMIIILTLALIIILTVWIGFDLSWDISEFTENKLFKTI